LLSFVTDLAHTVSGAIWQALTAVDDVRREHIESPVVGAIGTFEHAAQTGGETDLQREELDWLLTSGVLGRSGNVTRVLTYICEEHFQGRGEQIKEYTIATEALGRRPEFDPQSDTIVRVTVHSLRKRLLEIYEKEGEGRSLRLVIPSGHYAPSFIHRHQLSSRHESEAEPPPLGWPEGVDEAPPAAPADAAVAVDGFAQVPVRPASHSTRWLVVTILAAAAVATAFWFVRHHEWNEASLADTSSTTPIVSPKPQETIRALMGKARKPYVDHSGDTWTSGNYCQGGTNVDVPSQRIEGTEDAPIYLGGVRGIAHCIFPVTGRLYEVHFGFAETTDLRAATRVASLSINAGPKMDVDVVDNAGGDGMATSTVVTNVAPENDGAIHLDLTSETSLLNTVEILPAPSEKQLPVRIVAGPNPFMDSTKQLWSSDRYFNGGRHGQAVDTAQKDSLGVFASTRVGRFRYNIPAVPFARYRVKLYFREPWFGKESGTRGGPGSRVFDVECNGSVLLKNFDILDQAGSAPIIKTFEHVQASASGRIELYFMPIVNYPIVSAIEVTPQ
jgi:hypothetical protein